YGNSGLKTHPVGVKRPNGWGLYDMHGNVWEWCWDGWGNYEQSPVDDPRGPQAADRVNRGGSWRIVPPRRVRSADRRRYAPVRRGYDLGFRVARGQSVR